MNQMTIKVKIATIDDDMEYLSESYRIKYTISGDNYIITGDEPLVTEFIESHGLDWNDKHENPKYTEIK